MTVPINIRAIDHVVLRVADVSRSLHFYCDVLGCHEERRNDDVGLVQLRAGGSIIDLVDLGALADAAPGPGSDAAGRNMDHFAVRIDAYDEAALKAYLESHGIEPTEVRDSVHGAEGRGPAMYIQDPDGNTVELKGPPSADPT